MSAQRKDEKFYVTLGYLDSGPKIWFCKNQIVCMLLKSSANFGDFLDPSPYCRKYDMNFIIFPIYIENTIYIN
jgi:hypothetical protein